MIRSPSAGKPLHIISQHLVNIKRKASQHQKSKKIEYENFKCGFRMVPAEEWTHLPKVQQVTINY